MKVSTALLCTLWITFAASLPTSQPTDSSPAAVPSFASIASQQIATNLLKHNADIDANQVYSPLGVTSILAVLAEGAAGATYDEFSKALGYPAERDSLRSSFKRILTHYKNREHSTEPSFQTWLYIYRNYTARDEFKQVVRDHYLVEVKDINREEYDWSEPNTSLDLDGTTASNSKDVVGFETLKRLDTDSEASAAVVQEVKPEIKPVSDTFGEEVLDKPASKFDRVVDEKQYVEKPQILAEIKAEQEQQQQKVEANKLVDGNVGKEEKPQTSGTDQKEIHDDIPELFRENEATDLASIPKHEDDLILKEINKREDDMNLEENETVHEEEKLHKNYNENREDVIPIQEVLNSNEPEKVTLPLEKLESALDVANKNMGEIMIALESHLSSVRRVLGARSLFRKDDIISALSANSITGRENGSKTKMLLFNGLYYRGEWAYPFTAQGISEDQFFFMTAEDAIKTPMMHTKGKFHTAELQHLNAKSLRLPYENKRYAMMIILPNETEGLRSVLEKLQPSDFKLAKTLSQEKELRISMPKFQVEETTRSEAVLKHMGLKKLFSRKEADLSLLTDDADLHVDELVQFVSLRVDEGGSGTNALSAAGTEARNSDSDLEHIEINRPFLYFVWDCEEEFVIAAGKIYAPEIKEELPISIEVEFQQS